MYTVTTVTSYTVNGRTLQQTLVRYSGKDAVMYQRMVYLCTPQDTSSMVQTDNGKTIIYITSKE